MTLCIMNTMMVNVVLYRVSCVRVLLISIRVSTSYPESPE